MQAFCFFVRVTPGLRSVSIPVNKRKLFVMLNTTTSPSSLDYAMAAIPPSAPSWFNIETYASAVNLDFRGWATQIGNRLLLGMLLDVKNLDEFDRLFNLLIADPFVDLGYNGSFPSDKTVYPVTFGVVKTITNILAETGCEDKDVCDEKLRAIEPDTFAAQAILFVNLKAPKKLLEKQFRNWLEDSLLKRNRSPSISSAKIHSWGRDHPILPYQDLKLWHSRHNEQMPSDFLMADWLDLLNGDKETVRAIREKTERVFTLDCYFDLKFSASQADTPLLDTHN
jgi:hypothetical protein